MKIIKETKWQQATNLRGQVIMVKTVWEKEKNGKIYSRKMAMVKAS